MPNAEFQRINKQRSEAAGEEIYKNPPKSHRRHLKQLDPKITASRNLAFVSHGLGEVDPPFAERQLLGMAPAAQKLAACRSTSRPRSAKTSTRRSPGSKSSRSARQALTYQTDGMVMKVDSFAQRDQSWRDEQIPALGDRVQISQPSRCRRFCKAFDWQVGKAGRSRPSPTWSRSSSPARPFKMPRCTTSSRSDKLDLHIGDTVVLEKAGEMIP